MAREGEGWALARSGRAREAEGVFAAIVARAPGERDALFGLADARRRLVLGDGSARLVRIPPGVAHGVRNLGPARGCIIYFVDTQFTADPAQCEEGRLPWDFAGAEIWEPARG